MILMVTMLFLCIIQSLEWRIYHDAVAFLYVAHMIDQWHLVPYVDFFLNQLPGTLLFNLAAVRLFGYSDLGFRCADLLFLVILLLFTLGWMRRLDARAALFGTVAFGLNYLRFGPVMSMQREFLTLLPISLSLVVLLSPRKISNALRSLTVGFLLAIAASIKPHSAMVLPILILYQWIEVRAGDSDKPKSSLDLKIVSLAFCSLVGFVIPMAAMVLFMWSIGAIEPLLEGFIHYTPKTIPLTGEHVTLGGAERIKYLIKGYLYLGGYGLLLIPAGWGVFITLFNSHFGDLQKRKVLLLCGLLIVYSAYPVLPGKFWQYHWLPFSYFLIMLASLSIIQQREAPSKAQKLAPMVVLLVMLLPFIGMQKELLGRVAGLKGITMQFQRADEIADYLHKHLLPGDTVQALDTLGGGTQAIFMARARPATPFIWDFVFYHHVSDDYVQELRKRFVRSLREARPRFIIDVFDEKKPWPAGLDTTREFEELWKFIHSAYVAAHSGEGYTIYERRIDLTRKRQ